MAKYRVKSIGVCNKLLDRMRKQGYFLFQFQHGCNYPEGFYAWFLNSKKDEIVIHTFNEEVQNAILIYKKD